jgi:hypothetical protein
MTDRITQGRSRAARRPVLAFCSWSIAAVALAALAAPDPACAGELIAHASVNLTVDEVRDVYLGEQRFAGNLMLVPVDNIVARPEFLAKVLQTDERTYALRWRRKSSREGLAAPALLRSDAEVNAFVGATPGAVGYVNKRAGRVKILAEF